LPFFFFLPPFGGSPPPFFFFLQFLNAFSVLLTCRVVSRTPCSPPPFPLVFHFFFGNLPCCYEGAHVRSSLLPCFLYASPPRIFPHFFLLVVFSLALLNTPGRSACPSVFGTTIPPLHFLTPPVHGTLFQGLPLMTFTPPFTCPPYKPSHSEFRLAPLGFSRRSLLFPPLAFHSPFSSPSWGRVSPCVFFFFPL